MRIPEKVPFLQTITIIWGAYGLIWIALEGAIPLVLTAAISTLLVALLHWLNRLGKRPFSPFGWVARTAVIGTASGAMLVALTLFLMVLKTGLHAHGPEFTPSEINWVIQQLPLWSVAGGLFGGAFGLITAGIWRNNESAGQT